MATAADPPLQEIMLKEGEILCPFYPDHKIMLNASDSSRDPNAEAHFQRCHMEKMLERMRNGENVDFMVWRCKFNRKHVYLPEGMPVHERYLCPDRQLSDNKVDEDDDDDDKNAKGYDYKAHMTDPQTNHFDKPPPWMLNKSERKQWEVENAQKNDANRLEKLGGRRK